MGYKEDLIESIEKSLETIQEGGHDADPVILTMAGRLASIERTLVTARDMPENQILGVLDGMNKESTSLVSRYIERVSQIERQRFERREGVFRTLEIFLLVATTMTAGIAAYRSISIGEESVAISKRQASISEDQLKFQREQAVLESQHVRKTQFDSKVQEIEALIKQLNSREH